MPVDGCEALDARWPWPCALPDIGWAGLRFDRRRLTAADCSTIDLPFSIQHAAPKRQAEFIAGRLCARQASRQLTGTPCTPAIAASKAPCWPDGLTGSITHSGSLAAALVARTRDYQSLGLDAESLIELSRGERLAGRVLTSGERDWMAALAPQRQRLFLTLAFSFKESLFKALFPLAGVRFYFHHAELIDWEDSHRQVELRLLRTLSPAWQAGARVHGQYALIGEHLLSMVAIARMSCEPRSTWKP